MFVHTHFTDFACDMIRRYGPTRTGSLLNMFQNHGNVLTGKEVDELKTDARLVVADDRWSFKTE